MKPLIAKLLLTACLPLALALPLTATAAAASTPPLDTDGDGLTDALEAQFGSNSNALDSDGDGYADGDEVRAGYNPATAMPVPLEKWIEIDLSDQRLRQQLGEVVLNEFPISTGRRYYETPVGEYKILSKVPRAWSQTYGLWMPWWMSFKPRYGIHELPEWPGGYKEGLNHLGIPVSHGCVRLGVGPAKLLYTWAPVGTRVVVQR